MPRHQPYFGPLAPGQTRAQLGARMRRANAAHYARRMGAAAHQYAREQDLYGRAYRAAVKGIKEWWRKPTVSKKPTKQGKGSIHTGAFTSYGMNYSKNMKTKGKKGWKGKLTIPHNKKKSKQYHKKMPFTLMQRYFLTPPGNF